MFKIKLIVFYPKQSSSYNFPISINVKKYLYTSLRVSVRTFPIVRTYWAMSDAHDLDIFLQPAASECELLTIKVIYWFKKLHIRLD